MVEKIPITTLDLPGLEPYRTMKWQHEQREKGIFVAEGPTVLERLLESGLKVNSVLMPLEWFARFEAALRKRPEKIQAFIAEKKLLEGAAGFHLYQGVLAVAQLPEAITLDDLLTRTTSPLLVAAEGISSAENMGGLVRNCAAFGADGLLVGETSCSPYLRRAVRSSMGTLFKVPILHTSSLVNALTELKRVSVKCVAAHPHTTQRKITDTDFRGPLCIVLGAEGIGLSKEVLAICDEAVVIPMAPGIDSLNVGAAGAVFLYEAARQRGHV
jgi:tRNA G18 (ribose-2'-O)-methylase SpoU